MMEYQTYISIYQIHTTRSKLIFLLLLGSPSNNPVDGGQVQIGDEILEECHHSVVKCWFYFEYVWDPLVWIFRDVPNKKPYYHKGMPDSVHHWFKVLLMEEICTSS